MFSFLRGRLRTIGLSRSLEGAIWKFSFLRGRLRTPAGQIIYRLLERKFSFLRGRLRTLKVQSGNYFGPKGFHSFEVGFGRYTFVYRKDTDTRFSFLRGRLRTQGADAKGGKHATFSFLRGRLRTLIQTKVHFCVPKVFIPSR